VWGQKTAFGKRKPFALSAASAPLRETPSLSNFALQPPKRNSIAARAAAHYLHGHDQHCTSARSCN